MSNWYNVCIALHFLSVKIDVKGRATSDHVIWSTIYIIVTQFVVYDELKYLYGGHSAKLRKSKSAAITRAPVLRFCSISWLAYQFFKIRVILFRFSSWFLNLFITFRIAILMWHESCPYLDTGIYFQAFNFQALPELEVRWE